MNEEEPFSGIYKKLYEIGNTEEIKQVLREAKVNSPHLSGDIVLGYSKEDTISNLRRAVALEIVSKEVVHRLLWDSEENGQQHILLLIPANQDIASKLAMGTWIADKVFGEENWGNDRFPAFVDPHEAYEWADFRIGLPGANYDWIGKMYGHERIRVPVGTQKTDEDDEGIISVTRTYKYSEIRTVLVARWNHPHFLELRVDNRQLRATDSIDERRNELWKAFSEVFSIDDFDGFPIDKTLKKMVHNRLDKENIGIYSIGKIELVDPDSGKVTMLPCESGHLDDSAPRSATLQTALNEGLSPHSVNVKWSKNDDTPPSMPEQLDSIIKKTNFGPEVSIRKRVTPEVLNYVLDRIRKYAE
ncbi:hypothetical protein [Novipirellula maiorica]|uniref:hypothetical protein n=1 Tax=Novipirellula maiorica TaxID=1265734 RepID=UPI0011818CCE|nr:hypothetical protein [Rhodopirellula maiorica]